MSPIKGIRKEPCSACPYRCDVPSGVWAAHEYDKLVDYDNDTGYQPTAIFMCHATEEFICHGWAVVGGWDLLALRLADTMGNSLGEIPEPIVPLWPTHTAAAEHGRADIEAPDERAVETVDRLVRKYPRLQK